MRGKIIAVDVLNSNKARSSDREQRRRSKVSACEIYLSWRIESSFCANIAVASRSAPSLVEAHRSILTCLT